MTQDTASLANLHDIVMPEAVPWWPPASGWYGIGLLALVGLGWLLLTMRRRWVAQLYRRQALAELGQLQEALQYPEQRQSALAELPVLLKRAALAAWPRPRVAELSGSDWWRFLDQNADGSRFAATHGESLQKLTYQKDSALSNEEIDSVVKAVAQWIEHHHVTEAER
ncbi:MAG: DUF4381 domain-containing protein [Candidatus Competibacteraceae bacterium]|nr:DUF4381 domain-containing protein [Candidatus Competibacteraceae bacterium]